MVRNRKISKAELIHLSAFEIFLIIISSLVKSIDPAFLVEETSIALNVLGQR